MNACVRFAPMIGARPGELPPGDARALEAHLAACVRCRAAAADVAATEGLVREALGARANARDFAPFVDGVMARIAAGAPAAPAHASGGRSPLLAWLGRHRRAAAATLAPVLAALALIVYVRLHGAGTQEIAALEISAEGEVSTILETKDGPVVLLYAESGS
jgi:anti-sigma factor RsiW